MGKVQSFLYNEEMTQGNFSGRLKSDIARTAEHYSSWFFQVIKGLLFPESTQAGRETVIFLLDFNSLISDMKSSDALLEDIQELRARHEKLVGLTSRLNEKVISTRVGIGLNEYDMMVEAYQELIKYLHMIEQDKIESKDVLNPLTGLKGKASFKEDIKLELDRLDRENIPIALAIIRLDKAEGSVESSGEERNQQILFLASVVKKSLRSFDDVYQIEDEEFWLVLKQSDIFSATPVLERLNRLLKASPSYRLSVTSCVAEPDPETDLDELIQEMRQEILDAGEHGIIIEFEEQSPLQRFTEDLSENT